jgi:putative membrane protein
MRVFFLLLKIALFLLLFGFAIKNLETVKVRYFLGLEWQVPLIVVVLTFFGTGIAIGLVASVAIIGRQKRQILALTRELRSRSRLPNAAATAEAI